jgi:hypothetical protein
MDVIYRVNDPDDATLKVRALAFVDGERSFAKVLRPVTFVERPPRPAFLAQSQPRVIPGGKTIPQPKVIPNRKPPRPPTSSG